VEDDEFVVVANMMVIREVDLADVQVKAQRCIMFPLSISIHVA
jgi:hypothetical protein